ncbi:MAG: AMP-binding protein [Hyphomicrobiales bacterium]|nr:AMP-binding protein [Hyphomicrobiales bacterium]
MTRVPPNWPAMSLAEAHQRLTAPGAPFEMAEAMVDGHPMRVWKNAPPTLREAFLAGQAHGDRIFLVYEDERISFDAFARATLTLARWLAEQGVRKGDRVAVLMRNVPEWPVVFFAAVLNGAVAAPLNAWWNGEELRYGLADSGAKILFVDGERYERVEPFLCELPALEKVVTTRLEGREAPQTTALQAIIGAPGDWAALPLLAAPALALSPDDPASIMYTSGTTGASKGAVQSHRNSVCGVLSTQFAVARNFLRRGAPIPPRDPTKMRAQLVGVPFFHTIGAHSNLVPSLVNGIKLVMMHRFDATRALELIERERITSAGGVPTIAWAIVEHPDRAKYDLSSLELINYGGAPAASDLVRRIDEGFEKAMPGIGWGMTETTATFTAHSAEDYITHPESAGPPLPICDMKIAGDDGVALPQGAVGELWVYGPNVVSHYWNKPEANAQTFVDGWMKTGDVARVDADGFLYIVDRKKDMVIRGGENIYCIEVEDALFKHPAVLDVAVLGLPHRTLGEEPVAVVRLRAGFTATEDELRLFVRDQLAAFKVPVRIAFTGDDLPRNATGKLLKPQLRALFG